MKTHKLYAVLRLVAIGFFAVFVAGTLLTTRPFATPVAAKGVVKTQPPDESSTEERDTSSTEKKEEAKQPEQPQEEPRVSPPPSQPQREESSPSRTDDSAFTRREERRDEPAETPTYSPSQVRPQGTPDVRGQIVKREERRDPEYEFRRRYSDPFFYPYDSDLYSHYPYYDRGTVIIIDRDTWDESRHRWRRTYEYRDPHPGSLEEALVDIEAAWWEEDPELLMWHIDHLGEVEIYQNGKYSHALTPRQIYKLTAEAMDRARTIEFHFISVHKHGFTARAQARHEYVGPDRRTRTAYLTYYLEKVRERWVIDRIDIREHAFGSLRCFIATAAFGTPMEEEVLVLRQFREDYLLTNVPGRALVAVYYKVSPPIAEYIRGSESARAVVRAVLKPVVQLCKVVVPSTPR